MSEIGAKYVNEPELWKKTEDMVRKVLIDSGINFVEVANEAAFYGPKIDVQVWSAIGREFTIATNQGDFAPPAGGCLLRLRIENIATGIIPRKRRCAFSARRSARKNGSSVDKSQSVSSRRRLRADNFPLWLAPEQVRVLTLNAEDNLVAYAKDIAQQLRTASASPATLAPNR